MYYDFFNLYLFLIIIIDIEPKSYMSKRKIQLITRSCKLKSCKNTFECNPAHTKVYCSKKCANADPEVKQKQRIALQKVWNEKYNGKHPMANKVVQDKHKNTMIKNHGCEHALQNTQLLEKSKITKYNKYGALTNITKVKQTKLLRYGNENYNGHEKRSLIKYHTIVSSWKHLTPLFTESEFTGVSKNQTYKFKCNLCNYEFERNLDNGYIPKCKPCSMKNSINVQSIGEKEIIDYIRSISSTKIVERDRTVLHGKELDIYLPELNLAIEFNGIYWHSESNLQNKFYHLNKTTKCAIRGIQLLHIFDYQWYQKQEIVKSMLMSKLKSTTSIPARKCSIKKVNFAVKKEFLNSTHIQGTCNSSVNVGLYFNNELVAIATFGKSRYDKNYQWELLRYSTKLYTTVIGGFSKLLSYFIKTYKPDNILTYCDRTTSSGNLYIKTKFKLIGNTSMNYFYFKNASVFSREQFQKHKLNEKLTTFDSNLTEYENMQINGFDRFWDCGNYKFVYIP